MRSLRLAPALAAALALAAAGSACEHGGGSGKSDPSKNPRGDQPAFPFVKHVDQKKITNGKIGFGKLFDLGDELFEVQFNSLDGVGILALPDGTAFPSRFSRFPPGGGRFAGPNGQACVGCHNTPFPTSAGEAAGNVLQDPARDGVGPFNLRNATSLFGAAVLQRLAEEITDDLARIRDEAAAAAAPGGPTVFRDLVSKGTSYGRIGAARDAGGDVSFDTAEVEGVDPDLVVRPYGWKGNVTTLRDFVRGACRNELGMEPDELVAKGLGGADPLDPDGDGVAEELSVGDVTALTIYVGAQEIPTTTGRLVREGLVPPPPTDVASLAERGRSLFASIGCIDCHTPSLTVLDPVSEEPTQRGGGSYFDPEIDPEATHLDPSRPFKFHLVRQGDFPRLEPRSSGGAEVKLFGDLKRHAMGRHLADAQATPVSGADGRDLVVDGSPVLVAEAVFLTAELWGVGNTGPWLHDGRAGALEEAILLHGEDAPPLPGDPDRSEAQEARDAFAALDDGVRLAVVEFLRSLVTFALPEEGEEE